MKEKILILNHISGIAFFLSSFSLLGIPFFNLDNKISISGYLIAILFWSGILTGVVLQILIVKMAKKTEIQPFYKAKRIFGLTAVFSLLFVLILCFFKKSIVLTTMDIAFLLFSIEMYFYLKWRYSI